MSFIQRMSSWENVGGFLPNTSRHALRILCVFTDVDVSSGEVFWEAIWKSWLRPCRGKESLKLFQRTLVDPASLAAACTANDNVVICMLIQITMPTCMFVVFFFF